MPKGGEHLVEYPSNPRELPTHILQEAYCEDDQPQCGVMDCMDVISQASSISCRRTNKLIRGNTNSGTCQALVQAQAQPNPTFQFMQMLTSFMQGQGQEPEALRNFKPPNRPKRLALPPPEEVEGDTKVTPLNDGLPVTNSENNGGGQDPPKNNGPDPPNPPLPPQQGLRSRFLQ